MSHEQFKCERNTVSTLETVKELKNLNVDIYFEKDNIHSLSGDGELMLTILASFAHVESIVKLKRKHR